MTSPKWMVLGPLVIFEECERCRQRTEQERFYSKTWGEVMRRCLRCGVEKIDLVIR